MCVIIIIVIICHLLMLNVDVSYFSICHNLQLFFLSPHIDPHSYVALCCSTTFPVYCIFMAAHLWAGQYILPLCFFFILLLFFPGIFSAVADWMSAILPHVMWPCANLECRSEMCCTRFAENTGYKRTQKFAMIPLATIYSDLQ